MLGMIRAMALWACSRRPVGLRQKVGINRGAMCSGVCSRSWVPLTGDARQGMQQKVEINQGATRGGVWSHEVTGHLHSVMCSEERESVQ